MGEASRSAPRAARGLPESPSSPPSANGSLEPFMAEREGEIEKGE